MPAEVGELLGAAGFTWTTVLDEHLGGTVDRTIGRSTVFALF
jgi:hypothetical protein